MKNFNPYDIDPESIGLSKVVTDPRERLKYRLSAEIIKIVRRSKIEDVLEVTGLNRADLSRITTQNLKRFTIDRLIKILHSLGQSVSITVKAKKLAS
jgi:predicted XRE-type DNA-binding protein